MLQLTWDGTLLLRDAPTFIERARIVNMGSVRFSDRLVLVLERVKVRGR